MAITVNSPGILTTVQDRGRFGYQAFGVSASGEMDPRSAAISARRWTESRSRIMPR